MNSPLDEHFSGPFQPLGSLSVRKTMYQRKASHCISDCKVSPAGPAIKHKRHHSERLTVKQDFHHSMKAITMAHQKRELAEDQRKQQIKQALLDTLHKPEALKTSSSSTPDEDGLFNLESDCEPVPLPKENRDTIETVLCEICMPDPAHAEDRARILRSMRSCAATEFCIVLREGENGDSIGLFYFDGIVWRMLIGDADLPQTLEEHMGMSQYKYDLDSKSLVAAEHRPDVILLD